MRHEYSVLAEMCKNCPKVDTCNHKRMEQYAVLPLPETILEGTTVPLMREKMNSPLSPFVYKDDLEKEIYKALNVNCRIFGA